MTRRIWSGIPSLAQPAIFAFLAVLMAAACSKPSSDFGSTAVIIPKDSLIPYDASKPADTLRFASLNMSIGFPVSQLLFTDMADTAVAYVVLDSLFKRYQRGQPSERIKGMAKAIKDLDLDVVGLQEVMSFTRNGVKINDFLPELVQAIKDAGGPAYIAYGNPLNDTVLSGRLDGNRIDIAFHEGNAILIRPGFQVLDTARFIYFSLLKIETPQGTKTQRSLGYAKIRSPRGLIWQVYNTHLEVFEEFSSGQALELNKIVDSLKVRDGVGNDAAPQIVLGDFNVDPNTNAHNVMQEGGFHDTFDLLPHDSASTCCLAASALWNPDTTFSERRIDFIFARHITKVLNHEIALKGAITTAAGTRLMASDHRMLWTRVIGQ
jgi:endonuclease/exonuclease/phosphatase family metal-dependent hydrolase